MHKFGAVMLMALTTPAFAAEVIFTPAELAEMEGEPGPAGAQGPPGESIVGPAGPKGDDGLDGTRITELGLTCSADIGGKVFEWPCAGVETLPPEDPPPLPPDESGSRVNADGTATLVWQAPTERTDGTPIAPAEITRYRVRSDQPGRDWTYDGGTTTVTVPMSLAGCYTVTAFIGDLESARSDEVCLK